MLWPCFQSYWNAYWLKGSYSLSMHICGCVAFANGKSLCRIQNEYVIYCGINFWWLGECYVSLIFMCLSSISVAREVFSLCSQPWKLTFPFQHTWTLEINRALLWILIWFIWTSACVRLALITNKEEGLNREHESQLYVYTAHFRHHKTDSSNLSYH